MTQPNQYEDKELERIMANVLTAVYDVNQTKPGVIKVVDTAIADFKQLITQKQLEAEQRVESKYNNIVSTLERQVAHGNGLDQWQVEELLAELTTQKGK